jgi:hypothetical protein
MRAWIPYLLAAWVIFEGGSSLCAVPPETAGEVRAVELAFAKTMADRDLDAFASFLDEEAVFFGPSEVLRGKAEVVSAWSILFQSPAAAFSWAPDVVEVLELRLLRHADRRGDRAARVFAADLSAASHPGAEATPPSSIRRSPTWLRSLDRCPRGGRRSGVRTPNGDSGVKDGKCHFVENRIALHP